MFELFKWSGPSARRNLAMAEYEPVQPYFLVELASEARCVTFLDIGANIGAYSVLASCVPTVRRIVAFEANPKAAAEIEANAKLNDLSVEVHRVAVSDKPGEIIFGMVSDFAGNNAVVSSAMHNGFRQTLTVPTIALDSMSVDGPVCLKIDVEGHEPSVIAGATKMLTKQRCVVQMEGYSNDAGNALEALGYDRLTAIGPDGYYSNIPGLSAVEIYERAMQAIIESRHREKAVTIGWGGVSLALSGRAAELARSAARRLLGGRL